MRDIQEAKDPDLRACSTAMRRAAQAARRTAMQTGTNLIIVKEGKLTRISAQALRESAVTRDPQVSAGV
jgi:hypothetical protein